MVRLAEFVLRHRRLVMLFWLVMFGLGVVAAGRTSERLTIDFSLPGQPGYETEKQILDIYHNGGSNPPTIAVATVPEGSTVDEEIDAVAAVLVDVQQAVPGTGILGYADGQDPVSV